MSSRLVRKASLALARAFSSAVASLTTYASRSPGSVERACSRTVARTPASMSLATRLKDARRSPSPLKRGFKKQAASFTDGGRKRENQDRWLLVERFAGLADATLAAVLDGHSQCVNSLAWAPHSSCHICTAGDDNQALIWDLSSLGQKPISDPILAYYAESEVNQLQWSKGQPDWVAICFDKKLQILRV